MSTYENALVEYKSKDENDKFQLIYSYFGLAIYCGQVLEETFSVMLWTNRIFEEKINSNKEVNEIIDRIENSKQTMGIFIREVKQAYSLSDKITSDLKSILEKRNYLVHKYFKIEIQKGYSDLGRKEMLEYFGNFIDEIKNIDSKLNQYYSKYTSKMGFTDAKIQELVNQMKQAELNREKNYS